MVAILLRVLSLKKRGRLIAMFEDTNKRKVGYWAIARPWPYRRSFPRIQDYLLVISLFYSLSECLISISVSILIQLYSIRYRLEYSPLRRSATILAARSAKSAGSANTCWRTPDGDHLMAITRWRSPAEVSLTSPRAPLEKSRGSNPQSY